MKRVVACSPILITLPAYSLISSVTSTVYEDLAEKVKGLKEDKKVLEKLVKQYKNRKTNENGA